MTLSGDIGDRGLVDTRASRLLAFGGLFLIIAGMLLGDVFAVFILHPNNARIGEAMYAAAMAIPAGDVDAISSHFQAIGGFLENRGTKVAAHTHGIAVGYLGVLLAVLQPYVDLSGRTRLRLAWAYLLSAAILPFAIFTIHYAGLAYSPIDYIGWASIVADAAGLIVAVAVTAYLLGLWRYARKAGAGDIGTGLRQLATGAGRLLLVGGSLLLLAGFVYGAGYAAYIRYLLTPDEVEILQSIVSNSAAGQPVDAGFAAFGGYQAFVAINRAAHAHVNTMGMLLLVVAFVQPYVYFAGQTKRRWAWVLVIASVALPVSILLEFRFGLLAGGMADISGAVAIAALIAFLAGLVRRTGAQDSIA